MNEAYRYYRETRIQTMLVSALLGVGTSAFLALTSSTAAVTMKLGLWAATLLCLSYGTWKASLITLRIMTLAREDSHE